MARLDVIVVTVLSAMGVNFAFWLAVGAVRLAGTWFRRPTPTPARRMTVADVAVVIPAHNEEVALPKCLRALVRIIPAEQIHVASDGSRDGTVEIARKFGCKVMDIQPNAGKARALDSAIRHFGLCSRYQAILIQDADSEIDPEYLAKALPVFDDPAVVVLAGHVLSRWPERRWPSLSVLYTAYRTRLYRILQAAFQYGQSWRPFAVSYIAPGFASMYRTSVLQRIDIVAPGLVIEDFNMTFEVQRKKLGRVAYTPQARCSSEDPSSLRDYRKQVARWYLGFWQTVHRHGLWFGKFWLALGPLIVELVLISVFVLMLPALAVLSMAFGVGNIAFSLLDASLVPASPIELFGVFVAVDYVLTAVVAISDRRPVLLIYGFAFPMLRMLDAALFLNAGVRALIVHSDGRWSSPTRRQDNPPLDPLPTGDSP